MSGGNSVLIDPQTGLPYRADGTGPLAAGTDRSGTTSATANTSTLLAAANTARRRLNIQNVAATGGGDLYVNEFGGPASNAAGSYRLAPGGSLNVQTSRQINVAASAASVPYTATELS